MFVVFYWPKRHSARSWNFFLPLSPIKELNFRTQGTKSKEISSFIGGRAPPFLYFMVEELIATSESRIKRRNIRRRISRFQRSILWLHLVATFESHIWPLIGKFSCLLSDRILLQHFKVIFDYWLQSFHGCYLIDHIWL